MKETFMFVLVSSLILLQKVNELRQEKIKESQNLKEIARGNVI